MAVSSITEGGLDDEGGPLVIDEQDDEVVDESVREAQTQVRQRL